MSEAQRKERNSGRQAEVAVYVRESAILSSPLWALGRLRTIVASNRPLMVAMCHV